MQEVIAWGLIGWKYYANVSGPIQCEGLATLGVVQVACAEKRFLILSRNGRVYTQAYNSDTLVRVFYVSLKVCSVLLCKFPLVNIYNFLGE